MTNFHNGVISIPLRTPLAVHADQPVRRLCLDSVLAGQFYEQTNDGPGSLAHMREIIEHWRIDDDTMIPMASQAIFEGITTTEAPLILYRSIFRTVNDSSVRDSIPSVKWTNKKGTLERPYKSGMRNDYKMIQVRWLHYLFRGDVAAVEASFRRARRIGALRAKGGGEIDVDHICADGNVPTNSPLFGIVCGGQLMRPVPARCADALTSICQFNYNEGTTENWHAPFHEASTKEPCLVPVQTGPHMTLPRAEIVRLVQ